MTEPEKKSFTFTVTDEVDANDLMSLLINAFDGGATNYWAGRADVEYPPDFDVEKIPWLRDPDQWKEVRKLYIAPFVEGGKVTLYDNEDEDEEYVLDLEAIKRGVEVMSTKYKRHWNDFRIQNDDAITADVFIQCCVMGKVVFG